MSSFLTWWCETIVILAITLAGLLGFLRIKQLVLNPHLESRHGSFFWLFNVMAEAVHITGVILAELVAIMLVSYLAGGMATVVALISWANVPVALCLPLAGYLLGRGTAIFVYGPPYEISENEEALK
ncbi:MAG: hypothetical protein V1826_02555 [bacterium]